MNRKDSALRGFCQGPEGPDWRTRGDHDDLERFPEPKTREQLLEEARQYEHIAAEIIEQGGSDFIVEAWRWHADQARRAAAEME